MYVKRSTKSKAIREPIKKRIHISLSFKIFTEKRPPTKKLPSQAQNISPPQKKPL